ncbi:hypothetical protein OMP38_13740 [Cohnella ginsengisoli]|uniref:Uncharacterized protein n=1 Tax=Cohnella ginsengisoli TaxID=425004 RepID=A0A9X4KGF4_9BACL|nr:hypothetical protein [Cohnella ginsengisoli]MDG0791804.1 hypothetical protein [Cohnella ginsengisoli]
MQTSETIHPDKIEHQEAPKVDWHVGAIQSVQSEQGVYVFRGAHASIMLQPVNDHVVRVKLLLDHALDLKSTIAVQKRGL